MFDQPLDQSPELKLIPKLITKWDLAKDGLTLAVELRDDVMFDNGDKMTAEDFRYTFFERIKAGHKVDTQFLAQGHRYRGPVAYQGGDQVRHAGDHRAAVARIPRQLHGAEEDS